MKFLTSSSSSASSTITTATTATDGNVHTPRNTPGGCIAGVFRRLLCIKSLPTHPSDHHFKESENRDSVSVELDKLQPAKAAEPPPPPPSIVARLMGIESFPDVDFSCTKRSHNSVARSRSMNSVELMKELASIQGRHHRRAKSFREASTRFVELEDENFFILSFESGAKSRKSDVGSGKNAKKESIKAENLKKSSGKRRESIYEQNKENLGVVSVPKEPRKARDLNNILRPVNGSCRNHTSPVKENKNPTKMKKKKRKDDCLPVKKSETECNSDNSSPSSVLDIMKLHGDPEVSSCAEDVSRLTKSKSRRTLAEDLENYRKLQSSPSHHKCNNTSSTSTCEKSRSFEMQNVGLSYKYMWGEMCKLAGMDIVQSSWMNKFEECKEIGEDLEVQILDQIVGEIVDELVKF